MENLQYLSSEQALADLAVFIADLNSQQKFSRVITFGGSYPGLKSYLNDALAVLTLLVL